MRGRLESRAQVFNDNFSDDIHINITVDAKPGTTANGQISGSSFDYQNISYSDLLAELTDRPLSYTARVQGA